MNAIAEPKRKFPRAAALDATRELCKLLAEDCERLIVAGSLRRRKQMVGDIEIIYVPHFEPGMPNDLFRDPQPVNRVDARLAWMLDRSSGPILEMRPNKDGHTAWGPKNKLAIHRASGIPVDFFSTTPDAWWNYVVCRTGSAENNIAISSAAQRKGWEWKPYTAGFLDQDGTLVAVSSEREVFELVGLKYKEPQER